MERVRTLLTQYLFVALLAWSGITGNMPGVYTVQ